MKDIKSIISAKVKEGAKAYKNLVIENLAPYGERKKDRQGYIVTLNSTVRAMMPAEDDEEKYVIGERDFIFTSNFELLGVIKHNPQLRFLYRMAQADETLLEDIYIGSTINVLAEDVVSGEEYSNPFSFTDEGSVVANDSVYHSIYNLVPGVEAQETIEDCRAIKRDLRKDLLKEAMKVSKKARPAVVADDEDDED